MHPELKQLIINITVMFSVVLVPILVVVGAYRGLQAFTGNVRRIPATARSADQQDS